MRDDFAHFHTLQLYRVNAFDHRADLIARLVRAVFRIEDDH